MKQWNYLQASFPPDDLDEASGILWSLGTNGIEEDPLRSGKLRIKAYFDPLQDLQSLHREFKTQCRQAGIPLFGCTLRVQVERDWFKKWRQQLQPFTIGRRFQIVPFDRENKIQGRLLGEGDRIQICIEPSMAFGAGTHETTQLCLEALERYLTPGSTCLDVGTGSGILAIAAAKLGARKVVGCDIDPIAVEIAALNGVQNGCGATVRWVLGELEKVRRFKPGYLVANLTVELIEQEFWKFEQRLKPGALLIVSGLLNHQARRVERLRRRSSLSLKRRLKKGEWTCLIYVRS
ncbi:MAG: 50S ribosomal protein L11 methyltransferase [Acidobacteria bacterium]|nr:50S ribosomal protein L11 methyltransferase [Acidobacteriota bacterium]MCI0723959.1 50S ribosomal protein L11 methyltransferase [Acidobacteriota bacterium]